MSKKQQEGITLVEVMLIIVIGAILLYMSIQQYLSYRRDADALQVVANVNAIFQAMSTYYKQGCYGQMRGNVLEPGVLNPNNPTPPAANTPIDIGGELVTNGYMTALTRNPIVSASGAGTQGYIAQFNMITPFGDRKICKTGTNAYKGVIDPACTDPTSYTTGKVVLWQIQVAVKLNKPATATQYLNILAGDCLSSESGSIVTPCTTFPGSGDYVVWTRLPSNANTKALSPYWLTTPSVNRFKQMYTTYPVLDLTDGTLTSDQYYMCGN